MQGTKRSYPPVSFWIIYLTEKIPVTINPIIGATIAFLINGILPQELSRTNHKKDNKVAPTNTANSVLNALLESINRISGCGNKYVLK